MALCVIPARGGSKGVPRKNIRLIAGKPLIAHAIDCAKRCSFLDEIVVSTDDEEISQIARQYGALTPFMRPMELASDTAGMHPVLRHALTESERIFKKTYDAVVLLDPTAPLRKPEDVIGAFEKRRAGSWDLVCSGSPSHRNPYFNMVKVEDGGRASLVLSHEPPIIRRQDAPAVYDLNTVVWVYSRSAVLESNVRFPNETSLYVVPASRSIDLDTEEDFRYLEFKLGSAGGIRS